MAAGGMLPPNLRSMASFHFRWTDFVAAAAGGVYLDKELLNSAKAPERLMGNQGSCAVELDALLTFGTPKFRGIG